jgi:hypothetical protein
MWGLDPEFFAVVEPVLFNVWGDPLGVLNRQWKGKVVRIQDAKDGLQLRYLKKKSKIISERKLKSFMARESSMSF